MRSPLKRRAVLVVLLSLSGCPAPAGTAQTPDLGPPAAQPDLLAACQKEAPDPALPPLGRILQAAPERLPAGSLYTTGALPSLPPKLPDGPGKEQVEVFCVGCHSLRYIAMQPPLLAPQWEKEVDKMIRDYGAVVSDEARTQILGYLQASFAKPEGARRP